jgi:hypothetical protein
MGWKHVRIWFPRLAAALFMAVALDWFYAFLFTNFRAHQRPVMLPLAALTVAYAVALFVRKRWAVNLSLLLALLCATVAISFQVQAGLLHSFLFTTALLSSTYAIGLLWALKKNDWET